MKERHEGKAREGVEVTASGVHEAAASSRQEPLPSRPPALALALALALAAVLLASSCGGQKHKRLSPAEELQYKRELYQGRRQDFTPESVDRFFRTPGRTRSEIDRTYEACLAVTLQEREAARARFESTRAATRPPTSGSDESTAEGSSGPGPDGPGPGGSGAGDSGTEVTPGSLLGGSGGGSVGTGSEGSDPGAR